MILVNEGERGSGGDCCWKIRWDAWRAHHRRINNRAASTNSSLTSFLLFRIQLPGILLLSQQSWRWGSVVVGKQCPPADGANPGSLIVAPGFGRPERSQRKRWIPRGLRCGHSRLETRQGKLVLPYGWKEAIYGLQWWWSRCDACVWLINVAIQYQNWESLHS